MQSTTAFKLITSFLLILQVSADVSFNSTNPSAKFGGIVPKGAVSEKCGAAYAAPVKCTEILLKLRSRDIGPDYFNQVALGEFCTNECIESLNSWDKKVNAECSEEDKRITEDPTGKALYLSMVLKGSHSVQENLYWTFCLKDSDEKYCLAQSNLPAWPPTKSPSTDVTSKFCASECRTQQSYLMHRTATEAGEANKIDLANAEKLCPNLDTSKFAISSNMLRAFGSSAITTNSSSNAASANDIIGTGYDWNMYTENFANSASSLSGKGGLMFVVGVMASLWLL